MNPTTSFRPFSGSSPHFRQPLEKHPFRPPPPVKSLRRSLRRGSFQMSVFCNGHHSTTDHGQTEWVLPFPGMSDIGRSVWVLPFHSSTSSKERPPLAPVRTSHKQVSRPHYPPCSLVVERTSIKNFQQKFNFLFAPPAIDHNEV